MPEPLKKILPVSWTHLADKVAGPEVTASDSSTPDALVQQLESIAARGDIPAYLPDLARVELALKRPPVELSRPSHNSLEINPTLQVIEVAWHPLLPLLEGAATIPEPAERLLLVWQVPSSGRQHGAEATAADLLALKIVSEQLDVLDLARDNDQPVGVMDNAIDRAVDKGLLLAPHSKLRRGPPHLPAATEAAQPFLAAEVFTLQWHITHRCDLHCRHCYDRSPRNDVELQQGIEILEQMRLFCRTHHVRGQISFSGGNPFLHPDFPELYRAARDRNLSLAILGNPVSEAQLDTLLKIAKPTFFQVSLEGLEEHNDRIRGQGSYRSVLDFLELLRSRQIYAMVMLTLTRDNLDQVLPLAEVLRNRVDLFTYNRLAMVGEGTNLASPHPEEYRQFVIDYLAARRKNPIMALKDSLINIELQQQKHNLFGGCTGFGCGAAFNFVALLPDGQVHACRKFPSPIGDMNHQTLDEVYHSKAARAYRQGSRKCDNCELRLVCGGCLAVTHGWGDEPLLARDPDCFLQQEA